MKKTFDNLKPSEIKKACVKLDKFTGKKGHWVAGWYWDGDIETIGNYHFVGVLLEMSDKDGNRAEYDVWLHIMLEDRRKTFAIVLD